MMINRLEEKLRRHHQSFSKNSTLHRKARTRTLIQLGGLVEKSEMLEAFNIELGDDLQKNLDLKQEVFSLMGSLVELKQMILADELHKHLLAEKGALFFVDQSKDEREILEKSWG